LMRRIQNVHVDAVDSVGGRIALAFPDGIRLTFNGCTAQHLEVAQQALSTNRTLTITGEIEGRGWLKKKSMRIIGIEIE
jgi:hypothetical protein